MNVKTIGGYIVAFLIGAVSAVVGIFLHSHGKSDGGTEGDIERIQDTASAVGRTSRSLAENNGRFERLIEEIESQRKED